MKYSNTVYRAWWFLVLLINEHYAYGEIGETSPETTYYSAARDMNCSVPRAREAVALLRQWGFIGKFREGRKHIFYLSEKGLSYYFSHKDYANAMARNHEATLGKIGVMNDDIQLFKDE